MGEERRNRSRTEPAWGAERAVFLVLAVVAAVFAACDGEQPEPPFERRVRVLVPGDARLPGFGVRACSRGEASAPDAHRWCAFYRPSRDDAARTELWVINITRALKGEDLPCDGTSAGCLLMTNQLFTEFKLEAPSHPEAHRFEGDTLIFLAEASPTTAGLERYEGVVWAWRPGWQRPRPLTSDRGVFCRGHDSAPVAYCLDGVSDSGILRFDLRVGRVRDREDSVLPVVERIAPLRGGEVVWSAAFSPRGDSLAFSSWRDDEPAEALRALAVDEAGVASPRLVVEGGTYFSLSSDGQAVYFLRDRGSSRAGAGALWVAEFPAGTSPAEIAPNVFAFQPLGASGQPDRGVGFITDQRGFEGTLHLMRDRQRPREHVTLARDVHFWDPSADGRFVYILQVDPHAERGLLVDGERGTTCTLGSRAGAVVYYVDFLPRLGLMAWTEETGEDGRRVTFLGTPEGCTGARPLGEEIEYLQGVGARGLVLGTRDPDLLALSYVPVVDALVREDLREPMLSQVDSENIAQVGARPEALVVGTGETAPGGRALYLVGPLAPAD
jgi:hypothetical protein